jgi:ribosomal protein S18 acetylase RimI-like enzyme
MRTICVVEPTETLRLAEIGELAALAYLSDGLLDSSDPYLPSLRDARSRAEHAILLMAAAGATGEGAALGTITVVPPHSAFSEFGGDDFELRMLAVSPLAREKGVGEDLAVAAIEVAVDQGARRILLSTMETMKAAHRLYEKIGFVRAPGLDWTAHHGTTKTRCDDECLGSDGTCRAGGTRLLAYVWTLEP